MPVFLIKMASLNRLRHVTQFAEQKPLKQGFSSSLRGATYLTQIKVSSNELEKAV
jgi:hypothetical protein